MKLKICLRMGTNMSVHPLMTNPGISSTPTDLDGLKHLVALRTSESEIEAEGKNSQNSERLGKSTGHGLLYTN
jgi:hypothetical protein